MSYEQWTAVDPSETPVLTLDMAAPISDQGGGSITACTVAATVLQGADPTPQAIIGGPVDFSASPKVKVRKAAGGTADAYLLTFTATVGALTVVGSAVLPMQKGGA